MNYFLALPWRAIRAATTSAPSLTRKTPTSRMTSPPTTPGPPDLVTFHGHAASHDGTTVNFSSGTLNGITTVTAIATGTPISRMFVSVAVTQD